MQDAYTSCFTVVCDLLANVVGRRRPGFVKSVYKKSERFRVRFFFKITEASLRVIESTYASGSRRASSLGGWLREGICGSTGFREPFPQLFRASKLLRVMPTRGLLSCEVDEVCVHVLIKPTHAQNTRRECQSQSLHNKARAQRTAALQNTLIQTPSK